MSRYIYISEEYYGSEGVDIKWLFPLKMLMLKTNKSVISERKKKKDLNGASRFSCHLDRTSIWLAFVAKHLLRGPVAAIARTYVTRPSRWRHGDPIAVERQISPSPRQCRFPFRPFFTCRSKPARTLVSTCRLAVDLLARSTRGRVIFLRSDSESTESSRHGPGSQWGMAHVINLDEGTAMSMHATTHDESRVF
jgi:hypothetical protein